jgi:hypothetical protein
MNLKSAMVIIFWAIGLMFIGLVFFCDYYEAIHANHIPRRYTSRMDGFQSFVALEDQWTTITIVRYANKKLCGLEIEQAPYKIEHLHIAGRIIK